jgi:hypothetical protein
MYRQYYKFHLSLVPATYMCSLLFHYGSDIVLRGVYLLESLFRI